MVLIIKINKTDTKTDNKNSNKSDNGVIELVQFATKPKLNLLQH